MIIWLYHYFIGYLTVHVTGTSNERFLNMCIHHKIRIWNLYAMGEVYQFQIMRKDFKKLRPMLLKTNVTINIIERKGLPFLLFRYRKRKMFFLGFLTCITAIFLLSGFIWNIQINGNYRYTDEMILSFLNENEIQITMRSNQVNCADIVSMLRAKFEYITWVSAHLDGCELIITIKENDQITEIVEETEVMETISTSKGLDIIAQEGGIITSIITRNGTPLVHVGDVVEAGDILVSGCLALYNDSGEIVNYYYVESNADISIRTDYSYSNSIDLTYEKKMYLEEVVEKEFIRLGNYYFLALKLNKMNYLYDITRIENSLLSNQQNTLSLSIGKETYTSYEFVESIYTKEEVQSLLTQSFCRYCDELNEKKVEILGNDVNIYMYDNFATAKGSLAVLIDNDKTAITEIRELPDVESEEGIDE